MYNWKKVRNYRKDKNKDGTATYIIIVDGKKVEVNKEIYIAYATTGYKMENMEFNLKCDRVLKDASGKAVRDENGNSIILPEREISLESIIDDDWDYPSSELSPEDAVIEQFEFKELYSSLDLLETDERKLINALFFDGLTIREYAKLAGKTKSSVERHKTKILTKLKNFLNNK